MNKELKYDRFVVRLDDLWVAEDIVKRFGQPTGSVGLSEEEEKALKAVEREWPCWILSEGDIRGVAQIEGIDLRRLKHDQFDDIARTFKKGMEWACDDWELWLEEAIREEIRREGQNE